MLAQRPWLRVTLFVVVAAVILVAVGAAAYSLGTRNAADFGPRNSQIDRGDFDGPAQGGRGPQGDQDSQSPRDNQEGPARDGRSAFGDNQPQAFFRSNSQRGAGFGSPLAWLLRAVIGVALLGMLVLGTVAFFRTGGWRPTSGAEVVEAPKKGK